MKKEKVSITRKIKQSGIFESCYFILSFFIFKVISTAKIFILNLRLFKVSYQAEIGKGVVFFQSIKYSIEINDYSRIGVGVRIKSGFGGKIKIGKKVLVDDYSFISAHESIEIGDETMIAANCYIVDFNHALPLSKSKKLLLSKRGYVSKPVKIGKYVWIGANVVILPGVTIGDNAVIGAGAVVTKSIPANTIAVGNPAKVIRKI